METFRNPLIEKWKGDHATLGVWCSIGNSFTAEAAASVGFDYACVDLQHGVVDYAAAVPMLQAIGQRATPIVRVSWPEPWLIMQALDAGAYGVVVPMIETAEQAARVVAACRYPPIGSRSFGPTRASIAHSTADPDDLVRVACIVMIETRQALSNLDEIAATPGLDAVYVGPSDLALALGLPPRPVEPIPEHEQEIERILQTANRHGVVAGIHCASGVVARTRLEQGFKMVTVGNDVVFFLSAMRDHLSEARRGLGQGAAAAGS
ncbi:MAG: HpcH/HpaI aldolase family protein [Acidimicrobiia bacterium]